MKKLYLVLTLCCLPLLAEDPFANAVAAYDAGEFEQAFTAFSSMEGISPTLDYNRGNSLMRLGDPRRAVAYYRRALWQRPADPDTRANLERAVKETGASVPALPLSRRVTGMWNTLQWQNAFLLLCWLIAIYGIAGFKITSLRRSRAWVLPLAVVLLLISATGVWYSRPATWFQEAVLTSETVTARFAPLPDAKEHFSMPGGSVVKLIDQNRNWYRIAAGEQQGWVPAEELVLLKNL